jgi:uncharacterized protein (DUF924 family)
MIMTGNLADDVIRFWFEESSPQIWFVKDAVVDEEIRSRFLDLYWRTRQSAVSNIPVSGRDALAAVIVLDQFPRNMFRGSAEAFATDELALSIAQQAIAASLDKQLEQVLRVFLYMPFQHCEDRAVQQRSIELLAALGETEFLPYAREHKEIIDRFGRYPHRNAILGRISTPEEIEFLKTHSGF